MSAESDELLVVGKITRCYGIKGWLHVHSFTEPQENFLSLGSWTIERRGKTEPLMIDQGKVHGKGLVIHVEGVDDRTLAETYQGLQVMAHPDSLPSLEEGEYYWRELQGLSVWCLQQDENGDSTVSDASPDGILIGKVDHLLETGANDVLVVKACAGSLDDKERLIPYLPGQTVLRVDLDRQVMQVDWFLEED